MRADTYRPDYVVYDTSEHGLFAAQVIPKLWGHKIFVLRFPIKLYHILFNGTKNMSPETCKSPKHSRFNRIFPIKWDVSHWTFKTI